MTARRHVFYSGRVQGVGFRYTVLRAASPRAVTGFVRNLRDGRVELVLEGEDTEVSHVLAEVDRVMARYVQDRLVAPETPTGEFQSFDITFDT
jgi:acylphosphatase